MGKFQKGQPNPGKKFQPGVSGNPLGRKPLPKEIADIYDAATPSAARTVVQLFEDPSQPGNVRLAAALAILDRQFGKPVQAIEGTQDDGAITVQIIHFGAKGNDDAS